MSLSAQQLAAQKNISWVLAEKLAQKILTGEYQPESILPGEMELGEQFGVSRTAVREAVKTLTAKGMLLPRPRIGTRVMPRTEGIGSEELRLLSAVTPKGEMFYQGTAQALADKFIVFRDDYGAVSRLLLELIRAEALARGYHIITCPCAMHPEDKIDHILIPELKLAFLTDNRWHPVHLPSVQAVRCTRFLDRENLAAYRARLRFNERAAAELLEQASALMAQAKSCHDELETYYRAAVDFGKVDEAAAECMEMFGLK